MDSHNNLLTGETIYGFYLTYTAWVYFWRISFSMLFDFLKFVTGFVLSWLFYFLNGITETFLPKTEYEHILPWAQWLGRPSIFFNDSRFIFVVHVDSVLYLSIEHNPFPYPIYIKLIFLKETSNFYTGFKYISTTTMSSFCISLHSRPLFIGWKSSTAFLMPSNTHTHTHTHTHTLTLFFSLHFQPHGNS